MCLSDAYDLANDNGQDADILSRQQLDSGPRLEIASAAASSWNNLTKRDHSAHPVIFARQATSIACAEIKIPIPSYQKTEIIAYYE
jgi:hypothetical protein